MLTLDELLSPDGVAVVIAPQRGGTLARFLHLVKGSTKFHTLFAERFDPQVSTRLDEMRSLPGFNADEHQPFLLLISRTDRPPVAFADIVWVDMDDRRAQMAEK